METLFKNYFHRLSHFAWQIVHDQEIAQDVAQEAFLILWKNKEQISSDEISQKNFLYSTVKNLCYNSLRRLKVEDRFYLHEQSKPDFDHDDLEIVHKVLRSEVMAEIIRIIETMPEGCQKVFRLSYLEGFSNIQVAEQLAISINTVKTQKQRGLKIIRGKINPEFYSILLKVFGF